LQLAWSKGFRKIILESDSFLVVDLITNDKVIIDENYNLIMQARYFLAKDWNIQVIHVYRKTNSATDWLANYGLTRSCFDRFSNFFNDPPVGFYYNLYYDLIGSTLPRLI
jgi:ribonuclease HI